MAVNKPLVIIGSGLAAYSLIKEFRAIDPHTDIVVVTADRGDYYSKPQLSTAFASHREPTDLVMSTATQMAEKYRLKIITHTRVSQVDREAKKIKWDSGELYYDRLVLAVGAMPLRPLGIDSEDTILSVNHLEDYERFRCWLAGRKNIAILGSGLVGCEFAHDLIHTDVGVTVLSPDAYPLARLVPEKIGRLLQHVLATRGVQWQLNCAINHLQHDALIKTEGILSAIGLAPCVTLAEQAGLQVTQGICVNRYLQTADPDIYALGDCANVSGVVLRYIAPLLACARTLAKTLSGTITRLVYPPMPVVVKTPLCPISVLPPSADVVGAHWVFSGDDINIEALCYDHNEQLCGFALTGKQLIKRAILISQIASVFKD